MARRPRPWFWKARQGWYVTINGERHDLGSEKDEAYERFYVLMGQPRKRAVRSDALAVLVDAFLDWVSKQRSSETYEWYRYRLQRFIDRYPDLRTAEVRPFHAETWADEYTKCVTSRRNYLRSIKRCLRWAKKQGYIDTNPLEDLEVPSADRKEVCISAEEFDELMSFVRNRNLADLIETTWQTGCRPQESLIVEARHVDIENQRWVFYKSESKGKRISRVVYLTDEALAITRRCMLVNPTGPIFRNGNGAPWTTDAVNCGFQAVQMRMGKARMNGESIPQKEIAALMKTLKPTRTEKGIVVQKNEAELRCEAKRKLTFKRAGQLAPRYSLYALRHSWATNALQKGLDPLTVAILMGHEDPSTLTKVYQHLSLNPEHMLNQAKRAAS